MESSRRQRGERKLGVGYLLSSARRKILNAVVARVNATSFGAMPFPVSVSAPSVFALHALLWARGSAQERNERYSGLLNHPNTGGLSSGLHPQIGYWRAGRPVVGCLERTRTGLGFWSASIHQGQCLTLLVVKESHTITFPSWKEMSEQLNKLEVTTGEMGGEGQYRGRGWRGTNCYV